MKRDGWTFLTNQGHVLVCLAADPDLLLRDVASIIGITERAAQQIVGDLERAGVIVRLRVGRRNRYVVRRDERFRHPLEAGVTVGAFVDLVARGNECHRRANARAEAFVLSARRPSSGIDDQGLGEPADTAPDTSHAPSPPATGEPETSVPG